jgi:hypothetical protein
LSPHVIAIPPAILLAFCFAIDSGLCLRPVIGTDASSAML